jgi:hypothetical protein
MSICFFLIVHGDPLYFKASILAIKTILRNTDFKLFVSYNGDISNFPKDKRVIYHKIDHFVLQTSRPYRFLLKFKGVQDCINIIDPDLIIMMDVDAILIKKIKEKNVRNALDGFPIAMVEQKKIVRSHMDRKKFLEHYVNHSLKMIAPKLEPPKLMDFRYYNSGFVIAEKDYLKKLSSWAVAHIEDNLGKHEIQGHMIADQDYFQVWVNNIYPETCNELPWFWNHCEHWDDHFLDFRAIVIHFSNFCNGPNNKSIQNMKNAIFKSNIINNNIFKILTKWMSSWK